MGSCGHGCAVSLQALIYIYRLLFPNCECTYEIEGQFELASMVERVRYESCAPLRLSVSVWAGADGGTPKAWGMTFPNSKIGTRDIYKTPALVSL